MKRLRKNLFFNLSANGLGTVIDLLRNILVARILGPYWTGVCLNIMTLPQLDTYLNLGLCESTPLTVPYHRGRGDTQFVHKLQNTVMTVALTASLSVFLLASAYVGFVSPFGSYINGLIMLAAVAVFIGQFREYFQSQYVVEGQFGRLSALELALPVLMILFQVALVSSHGAYGFWLGLVGANAAVTLWAARDYFKKQTYRLFAFDRAVFRAALPNGIVFFIASVAHTPFVIAAKLFLGATLGAVAVGYFFIAVTVITKIAIVPRIVARLILPRLSFLQGTKSLHPEIFSLFGQAQLYTLLLTALAVLIGWLSLGRVIAWVMPAYVPGVTAGQYMLLAALPYSLVDNASQLLIVAGRKRLYLGVIGIVCIFQVVALGFLAATGVTLERLSLTFVPLFCVYAAVLNYLVFHIGRQRRQVSPASGSPV